MYERENMYEANILKGKITKSILFYFTIFRIYYLILPLQVIYPLVFFYRNLVLNPSPLSRSTLGFLTYHPLPRFLLFFPLRVSL